jgi:hypothetical protein
MQEAEVLALTIAANSPLAVQAKTSLFRTVIELVMKKIPL